MHRCRNLISFCVILSVSEGSSHLRQRLGREKILRHFVPQKDINCRFFRIAYTLSVCHPERQRRIFASSEENRFFVTSFLRMTYTEGAPERIQDFCQGFFPCHPERMRRIFALSIAKRFFVTSFLRMTYTGASYYICEARFYYAPTVFSTRSRHSSASAQPTTETAMQTSSILLTPTASISVPPSA